MATAVLICMENSFWNRRDGDFVESFKKSFTLYVDSGMRKKAEAEIDELGGESKLLASEDFNARFRKLIIEHFLRMIHCFYMHSESTHLTTSFAEIQPTPSLIKKNYLG